MNVPQPHEFHGGTFIYIHVCTIASLISTNEPIGARFGVEYPSLDCLNLLSRKTLDTNRLSFSTSYRGLRGLRGSALDPLNDICVEHFFKRHIHAFGWCVGFKVRSYAPVPVPATKRDNDEWNSQQSAFMQMIMLPEPTLWRPRSFTVRSAMKLSSFARLCSAGMVLHHVSSFVAKPALSSSATANAKIVSFDVTCFTYSHMLR